MHFKLKRDSATGAVTVEDNSSNGTYLNGNKIGKNRRTLLSHNDRIGLASNKAKHFVFLSNGRDHAKAHPADLRKKYLVSRELGKGACGTVLLGIRREDGHQVAIKAINKTRVSMLPGGSPDNVMNEVRLLQAVDHPCIIRLEDVVDTDKMLYIILELADGGELFEKIIQKTKLQETEARIYFYQMVSAIEYLHKQNICHRDLKPENVMLCSSSSPDAADAAEAVPVIKVTDLGLSKFVDMESHLKTFCGTPQYLAPEVLFSRVRGDGSYDFKVDMWSLGVILYILLCGCPPFNPERKDKPLIRQVTEGDWSFPDQLWSTISGEAKALVRSLMTVNPAKRLDACETLKHPWFAADPDAVKKAKDLMDSQKKVLIKTRTMSTGLFSGILPAEIVSESPSNLTAGVASEEATTPSPTPSPTPSAVVEPTVPANGAKQNGEVFKRPLEEKEKVAAPASACKKARVNGGNGAN